MTTESAAAAPEGKRYKYYGREYKESVQEMAALARVSVRLQKDVLKLHSLGYRDAIAQGYTAEECFAHAGIKRPKRRKAPTQASIDEFKTVIIYLRGQVHDAVDEIKRLRELVFDLGVDPDG